MRPFLPESVSVLHFEFTSLNAFIQPDFSVMDGSRDYEPLTAHMFRRSCTSERVRGSANLYHVSRMLGMNPWRHCSITSA